MHGTLASLPLVFKRPKLAALISVDGFQGVRKVGHDLFLDCQLLAQASVVLQLVDVAQHADTAEDGSHQEADRPPAAPSAVTLSSFSAAVKQDNQDTFALRI